MLFYYNKIDILSIITIGPTFVCVCCGGLFFRHYVYEFKPTSEQDSNHEYLNSICCVRIEENGKFAIKSVETIQSLTNGKATKENTIAAKFEWIAKLESNNPNKGYNNSGSGKKSESPKIENKETKKGKKKELVAATV